jgi:hypothetical protein
MSKEFVSLANFHYDDNDDVVLRFMVVFNLQ